MRRTMLIIALSAAMAASSLSHVTWLGLSAFSGSVATNGVVSINGGTARFWVPSERFAQVSDIIGRSVRDPRGEDIGKIADLLVTENHQVIAAVVSVGGLLGIGDKLVAVSFAEFQRKADGSYVLDAKLQQLEKSPAFDPDVLASKFGAEAYRSAMANKTAD